MKKLVLLFAAALMSLTTVTAAETVSAHKKGKHLDKTKRYRYAQPIVFVERGVEFLVFPDGSFDFNTQLDGVFFNDNDFYYRDQKSRRGSINTTYGTPNATVRFSKKRSRGVLVLHDRDGKVRRIGNMFLNYDKFGKIKRIGSIYMSYNRGNGRLKQVGGLRVNFNRWGEIVHMRGQVSPFSDFCGVCGVSSCSVDHFHDHDNWNDDWYGDDDDFYYYKQNGKVKKQKKHKR